MPRRICWDKLGWHFAFVSSFSVHLGIRFLGSLRMRVFSKRIALLCLMLTLWSALAFVAHHHSSATDAAKCTVCLAAHSASPKSSSQSPKVTFVSISTLRQQPVSAKQSLVVFALSVRPPPSV